MQTPDIPGADSVVSWFGSWPTFHDAEVLGLQLNRKGRSWIKIYAWNISRRTYEKDGKQYFILEKHAVVTFLLEGIVELEMHDFSSQNVVSDFDIERHGDAFLMTLEPCYGLSGTILASHIAVQVTPGEVKQDQELL